jgi:hypothetical protein
MSAPVTMIRSFALNTVVDMRTLTIVEQENGRDLSALTRVSAGIAEILPCFDPPRCWPQEQENALTDTELATLQRASARAYAMARVYMEIE